MENQTKKPFYKKWWVWVIGVVVLFAIVGAAGNSTKTTVQTSGESATNQATETASASKQYQEVFKFSGNGAKKSEPFTIQGSRFKIAYDCKGDPNMTLCQAFVFKVGSTLPQNVMNSPQSVKDETVIYGSGEYYIDANVIGNYTMTVYDYK